MASLSGSTIASTYQSILALPLTGGDTTTLVALTDGDGVNTFALKVATTSISVGATNKIYLDAGSDTYIYESGADVLDFYVGGANMLKLTESSTDTVLITGDLTVGVDGTGHDVIFYGDSASSNMTWDEGADDLILNDARLYINQDDEADSILIDSQATSANIINIDSADTLTTGAAIRVDSGGTALASTATGGLVEILHTGDSDTNVNNLLYILNDVSDAVGTTALKIKQDSTAPAIDLGASEATGGAYMVNEQGRADHVANTMPAPYYRFDGVDDVITVDYDADLDWGFGDGTVAGWVYFQTIGQHQRWISRRTGGGDANNVLNFYWDTGGYLAAYQDVGGTTLMKAQATWSPVAGTWYHLCWSFKNATSNALYVDGVALTLTTNTITGGNLSLNSGTVPLSVGEYVSNYFKGSISSVKYFNNGLSATEVKQLYSGVSVPHKYVGGSQTVVGSETAWSGASGATPPSGWAAYTAGLWAIIDDSGNGAPDSAALRATVNDTPVTNPSVTEAYTVVVGKAYRVSVHARNVTATNCQLTVGSTTGAGEYGIATTTGTSWQVISKEFTATTTLLSVRLYLNSSTDGHLGYFDQVLVVQIGAVVELDGSGAGKVLWHDKSGNDLHGTVTGAIVENTPADADSGLTYEEGTWTPVWASANSSEAAYVKIGRMVYASGQFVATGTTSGSCSGLPYTSLIDGSDGGGSGYHTTDSISWNVLKISGDAFRFYAGDTQKQMANTEAARFFISYLTPG